MKFIPKNLQELQPEIKIHSEFGHTWTETVYPKRGDHDCPDFEDRPGTNEPEDHS